jgi:hypothetical protein
LYIDDASLGCPLLYDESRPYVNWQAVEDYLIKVGIIKLQGLIKISRHPTSSNLMLVSINPIAMKMLGMWEIIFCDKYLTIKEPNIDTRKTFKINKKHKTFTFGAKNKEPEELQGKYELEKVCDGEFLLNLV